MEVLRTMTEELRVPCSWIHVRSEVWGRGPAEPEEPVGKAPEAVPPAKEQREAGVLLWVMNVLRSEQELGAAEGCGAMGESSPRRQEKVGQEKEWGATEGQTKEPRERRPAEEWEEEVTAAPEPLGSQWCCRVRAGARRELHWEARASREEPCRRQAKMEELLLRREKEAKEESRGTVPLREYLASERRGCSAEKAGGASEASVRGWLRRPLKAISGVRARGERG